MAAAQGVVHDWCAAIAAGMDAGLMSGWLMAVGVDNRRIRDGCGPHVWLMAVAWSR